MATAAGRPPSRPARPRRRARTGPSPPRLSPDVTRSIVALVLLVLGVVILVGLLLPGKGALTDWILAGHRPVVRDRPLAASRSC